MAIHFFLHKSQTYLTHKHFQDSVAAFPFHTMFSIPKPSKHCLGIKEHNLQSFLKTATLITKKLYILSRL